MRAIFYRLLYNIRSPSHTPDDLNNPAAAQDADEKDDGVRIDDWQVCLSRQFCKNSRYAHFYTTELRHLSISLTSHY